MSYRNAFSYLTSKTRVLELSNQFGGRVAVCPEWNGRVMTSTCDGLDGGSFGLVNVALIDAAEAAKDKTSFNFYGGEDQLTLSPEGGPFNLYYAALPEDVPEPSSEHFSTGYTVPVGCTEGIFTVDSLPQSPEVRMRRSVQMTNLAGAQFDLDQVRTIRLMRSGEIADVFGDGVSVTLEQTDVDFVAYSSTNALVNCGTAHSKLSGLVSIRMRSMFNAGQNTIAVLPFRRGSQAQLGVPVCTDFFGSAPHGRVRRLPGTVLFRADSKFCCQVGLSRRRALPVLGAIDFREGTLTLVAFNMPKKPWKELYLSNAYCETASNTMADFVSAREFYLTQMTHEEHAREMTEASPLFERLLELSPEETPYTGEVVRVYNHGSTIPGEEPTSRFFEFDIFSPARELVKGESITHLQHTLHVRADNHTLEYLVKSTLNVEYDGIFDKMFR